MLIRDLHERLLAQSRHHLWISSQTLQCDDYTVHYSGTFTLEHEGASSTL